MTINGPFDLTTLNSYLKKSFLIKSFQEENNQKNIVNYLNQDSKLKVISVEHNLKNYFVDISIYEGVSKKIRGEVKGLVNKIRKNIEIDYPGWRSPEHWKKGQFNYIKSIQK